MMQPLMSTVQNTAPDQESIHVTHFPIGCRVPFHRGGLLKPIPNGKVPRVNDRKANHQGALSFIPLLISSGPKTRALVYSQMPHPSIRISSDCAPFIRLVEASKAPRKCRLQTSSLWIWLVWGCGSKDQGSSICRRRESR